MFYTFDKNGVYSGTSEEATLTCTSWKPLSIPARWDGRGWHPIPDLDTCSIDDLVYLIHDAQIRPTTIYSTREQESFMLQYREACSANSIFIAKLAEELGEDPVELSTKIITKHQETLLQEAIELAHVQRIRKYASNNERSKLVALLLKSWRREMEANNAQQ